MAIVCSAIPTKRGILASDAQRKPGAVLGAKARTEVDYLLARLEKAGG